ncbi:hypothetical protein E2C01_081039 [Portunus trituberculatus]|uniref:Uncharacterized protein n=1 Tax=Portunus trituberculatus TaxID=210409 RepID=A0A5B7IVJ9_PORTR|nr:hypothetical protein [Portunus trituberculatus]
MLENLQLLYETMDFRARVKPCVSVTKARPSPHLSVTAVIDAGTHASLRDAIATAIELTV